MCGNNTIDSKHIFQMSRGWWQGYFRSLKDNGRDISGVWRTMVGIFQEFERQWQGYFRSLKDNGRDISGVWKIWQGYFRSLKDNGRDISGVWRMVRQGYFRSLKDNCRDISGVRRTTAGIFQVWSMVAGIFRESEGWWQEYFSICCLFPCLWNYCFKKCAQCHMDTEILHLKLAIAWHHKTCS